MLTISRSLARQLRAVLRRMNRGNGRLEPASVLLTAGRDGLSVSLCSWDHAAVYHQAGSVPADEIAIPLAALDDFAGKSDEPVILEAVSPGKVQARWNDANVPQIVAYECSDGNRKPAVPEAPTQWTNNGPELLRALRDAIETSGELTARPGLNCVQLTGSNGRIAATNGKQLLVQEGYRFPWSEALLVPRSPAVLAKEVPLDASVEVGRTKTHVALRLGNWTFYLRIDADSRFPNIDAVIPRSSQIASRCKIAPEDAGFLLRTLPRLPGQDDEHAPVTIDLHDGVVIRAKAAEQGRVTEVVLQRSMASGKAIRFCTDRELLARALNLGFNEIQIVDAATPILCEDGHRRYVWMALERDAISPTADAVRIVSDSTAVGEPAPNKPRLARHSRQRSALNGTTSHVGIQKSSAEMLPAPFPNANQEASTVAQATQVRSRISGADNGLQSLIDEAEALKSVLRDAYTRTHHILATARRQRKQANAVQAAMASLRQLDRASA